MFVLEATFGRVQNRFPTVHLATLHVCVQILAALETLAAGSPDPTWLWHAVAAPADLAALQAAADKGQSPAADNWKRWQASRAARELSANEPHLPPIGRLAGGRAGGRFAALLPGPAKRPSC